jgi:hypothetical protein
MSGSDLSPLQQEIVHLLQINGPMDWEDVRTRLCIASQARMEAAVMMLQLSNVLQQITGSSQTLRLVGDSRPPPVRNVDDLYKRRRAERAAANPPVDTKCLVCGLINPTPGHGHLNPPDDYT